MARTKETPRPLLDVKADFYASLDAFVDAAMLLEVAVETALELGQVNSAAVPQLRDRVAALVLASRGGG